jgi:hypothetical protein
MYGQFSYAIEGFGGDVVDLPELEICTESEDEVETYNCYEAITTTIISFNCDTGEYYNSYVASYDIITIDCLDDDDDDDEELDECDMNNPNYLGDCECYNYGCEEDENDEEEEDDCTEEIANEIKQLNNPVFKSIIDKFNNPNSPYKVNIFNGPIQGSGAMAQTQPTSVRGTFNIVTNENYNSETSLMAAANILHEYIHAYFNTLWLDWKDNGNTHVYDNYPELKNYYMNHTYAGTAEDAHHEQMADSFINDIADALKELEPGLQDQYYKDMAWATLDQTPVFDSDLNETERNRIIAIRESEVTNSERGGNQPKGKPCNK